MFSSEMKTICVNSVNSYIDCDNHWINHSYEFVEDIFLHFSRLICIIAFRHQHIIVSKADL